jgi:hypothetical protein
MSWMKAALALLSILQLVLEMARSRRDREAGAAEAILNAATEAANVLNKARAARLDARRVFSDPRRLLDDDGFRRK